MLKTSKISVLALFILFLIPSIPIRACTGIRLTAQDGSIIHGRTLEFGTKIDSLAAVVPRGYSFNGSTTLGNGLSYQAKYAAVGAFLFNIPSLMDGINEKGLAVGTFYFPGFAQYATLTQENQSKALSPIEFPNWILTQFESLEEVRSALADIVIVSTPSKAWGNSSPPFHYIVYDKAGNSLVIEPIGGKLVVYDNPFGVITNSPTFDWHMNYLRNFINLRTVNIAPLDVKGIELAPFGQGSGMVGLPGDFTPPSRFVRAAIFSYTAIPSNTAEEATLQLFHILNQFDIPIGVAREVNNGVIYSDYTMVTCVRDPQALKFYFKTYEDQTIRVIDLNHFDLNAKSIKSCPTTSKQTIIDISSNLKSNK